MSGVSVALQVALFQRLAAELSCPVYDAVPMGAAYPYVTLDYEVSGNADYLSRRKDERFIYIAVWSNYQGQAEAKRIMADIDAALHGYSPGLTTGRVVSIRIVRTRTSREPDGRTYMGQVTIRIITEH